MPNQKGSSLKLSSQTPLNDILKVESNFVLKNKGQKIIEEISKELEKDDLKYIFFYFREEMQLINCDFFKAATLSTIASIENCLRNSFYELATDEKTKNSSEELGMGQLRQRLEPRLSVETNVALKELNNLRNVFVHTNMNKGKKYVLNNKLIECSEQNIGGGSVLKRESTRTLINMSCDEYAKTVILLSLKIVKELYPSVGKMDDRQFENIVRQSISTKNGTIYH